MELQGLGSRVQGLGEADGTSIDGSAPSLTLRGSTPSELDAANPDESRGGSLESRVSGEGTEAARPPYRRLTSWCQEVGWVC